MVLTPEQAPKPSFAASREKLTLKQNESPRGKPTRYQMKNYLIFRSQATGNLP